MDAEQEASRTNLVGGFIKGLTVIEAFDVDRPRQSIADISRTTGYDRATCRRLLLTLVHAGYAEHDGKYFWLSPRTVRLGNAYLHSATLPNIVQPYLEALAEDIHESCSASILDGDEVLYIARASHQRVMSINLRIGSRLPLYCSSMGRVLLASFDDAEVRRMLEQTPRLEYTATTVTDIDALADLIRQVREDGYAIVDQELEVGLRSIAVPVIDKRGNTLAALNIGTHAARVPAERLTKDYLPRLNALQVELREIV
jgi:IclR family pca regulon transcriptional regulator